MTKRIVVLALAAVAALAIPACTKSDSTATLVSTSTTTSGSNDSPAKERFVEDANAECADMNAAIEAKSSELDGEDEYAALVDASATIIDETFAAIRALPQPPGDEVTLTSIYDELARLSAVARDLAAAIRQGDERTQDRLATKLEAETAQVNRALDDYGLTVCGSNPTDSSSDGAAT